ncbi:GNAT family N-acetyltransferase [Effusibacillus consociatus]|uniref:GNAT family N-acetyltransferase n=1 Tax=Effusibacillus consociatus TaxID=1117041 RepID=A0ABV9Q5V4_9BACL
MITIKRLSKCTFEEAVRVWNEGFQGYYFDTTTTADAFTARLAKEGLSPSLSIIAFVDNQPAGLILNGVRIINDRKVAWNGGTGVSPQFRRKGVGKALIDAALQIYREEKVEIATLEAIGHNEKAIALYEKMGYKVIERLLFFHKEDGCQDTPFANREREVYQFKFGMPQDLRFLPFYKGMYPWQCQWQNAAGGVSAVAYDVSGEAVGYALYMKSFDDDGNQTKITLLQCEAKPNHEDTREILCSLLAQVYAPLESSVARGTFNLPETNEEVSRLHREAGFTIKSEQVMMIRYM